MRRLLGVMASALAIALAMWGSVSAAEPCPPQPAPLTAATVEQGLRSAVDRGLLWRISKGGRVSWLYGTLHVGRQPWMFPGPQVREAMQSADQVALELDLLDPAVMGKVTTLMLAGTQPVPLPEALDRRLKTLADSSCAGPELAMLRPELQAVSLTIAAARRAGLEAAYGADLFLALQARRVGKPVLSLETPESQIGLLLQDTPAETARFVDHALGELESGQALPTLERLAEAWARGDWNELSHYADWCRCLDTEEDRALMRKINDERNLAMAAKVAARHEAGERLFVAVGALHMIGPEGLPSLLAARGFEVRRMEPGAAPSAAPPKLVSP
ncbi:TraB/GumN family protein [Ideonella sp. YS5]|uniref:TraB/GumN family protein n=1 Tax=Ideonella sp. YS5 TaxID=3453714 RepID=UPI003EE851E6